MAVPLTVFYRVKRKKERGSENLDLSEFFEQQKRGRFVEPIHVDSKDDDDEPRPAIRTGIFTIRSS